MTTVRNYSEKPRLAIFYAYAITFGGVLGIILFILIYIFGDNWIWLNYYFSPVVFAISIFLISCLGLVTGNALLKRKKYGWILSQFFFIFLLIKSVYSLFFLPFFNLSTSFSALYFIKFFFVMLLAALLLFSFNQKDSLKYYKIELEDANRIYLISFLTSLIIISLAIIL